MDEARTRQEIIDEKLSLAGWNVHDPSQVSQEFDIYLGNAPGFVAPEITTPYTGHQFADYLLLGKDGQRLAIVEAKRTAKDPDLGKEQALQYVRNIQRVHGGRLPIVLYTNGHEIYLWDSDHYPPRKIHGFPTRDDLVRMHFQSKERRPLSVELIDTSIAGRPYQLEAIRAVLEELENNRRKFLLVMATGTGKTRTCMGLVDVMMRAHWVERVLFLVDRIPLRDQARDDFRDYIPNAPLWPKTGEKVFSFDRRVYVATYPTMLNLIEDPNHYLSPHFFDLVVADESHRSIYNVYKSVLDYFDAFQLGLTATPTDRIEHDTFKLFNYEIGNPTFAYTYEEAVNNVPPYLCNFEVLNVRSKFQLEGIRGETLTTAEQKKMVAQGLDWEEINFEGTDLERKVTNSDTNRLIVREFMEESIKDDSGTLPGKSIFFAISKGHARRLEAIFDALYPEHKGKLARVLVSDDPRVYGKGGLLDQFKTQDMPRVAISVDMLDTGVDVREVVNLVFAKPVFSYTKFWQMIGRGTRVLDDDPCKRKPWCIEKDKFLIIDSWGNFAYFKLEPKGREPGQQVPMPVTLFRTRLAQLQAALRAKRKDVIEKAKAALRNDLAALPENNVIVLDNQALLATVNDEQFWAGLKSSDLPFLRMQIAPLLRARSNADFKAMRFEKEVVELSTALLTENDEAVAALRESLCEQVGELPLTVNVVARQKELITALQDEPFWRQLQAPDTAQAESLLAELTAKLAPLMKFRQRRTDPILKLDVGDLLSVKEWIEFGPAHERLTTAVYRERLEALIQSLVGQNPVLQKLQRGELVSDTEVLALANLLRTQDPYVTEEILRKVYDHKSARFIQFIRHILGLEKLESWSATVARSFDDFIVEHNTFSALQIRFIQTIKTFILQTGKVEKRNLIEAPFTQLHPQGIRGVFPPAQIDEIIAFTEKLIA